MHSWQHVRYYSPTFELTDWSDDVSFFCVSPVFLYVIIGIYVHFCLQSRISMPKNTISHIFFFACSNNFCVSMKHFVYQCVDKMSPNCIEIRHHFYWIVEKNFHFELNVHCTLSDNLNWNAYLSTNPLSIIFISEPFYYVDCVMDVWMVCAILCACFAFYCIYLHHYTTYVGDSFVCDDGGDGGRGRWYYTYTNNNRKIKTPTEFHFILLYGIDSISYYIERYTLHTHYDIYL